MVEKANRMTAMARMAATALMAASLSESQVRMLDSQSIPETSVGAILLCEHLHLKQFPIQSVQGRAEQPLHQGTADPRAERDGDVEEEAGQGGGIEGPLAD